MGLASAKVMIADDEKNIRELLRDELSPLVSHVVEVQNGSKALELIEKEEFDVLLLDMNMPGLDGIDVLKSIKSQEIPTEVIILTAHATVMTAVEAMKLGAYDYLMKPFKIIELAPVIEKAYEKKKLRNENLLLKTQVKRQWETRTLIAESPAMREVLETAAKVAGSAYPVLITGESGTGKELVARTIHAASSRSDEPYVVINCGALPENMIESELFGYEKGAFTGAHARKPGLLEIAHQGTLFLDEIGDMPQPLQVKLLRVIETGCFYRLGGTREMKVDMRVLSATNKDLKAEIEKGTFRQDLYYRVSALNIFLPPLRDRQEDIVPLIRHFQSNDPVFRQKTFTDEALNVLSAYAWPGNVRELQHVVHRVLLLARGNVIGPGDLPPDLTMKAGTDSARLDDRERQHILTVLKKSGGDKIKAAEILGIHPKTLARKLSGYGRSW
ncbi:MAG: sigma-54 dependent transcriptional regulator [Nitrospiraceae bacterium]|nr:sigma-54 dependent transcriptional regulator [Nitrospiraceae bacterium]